MGAGYRTFDTHLFAEKWENSALGIGGVFYRDVAGALNFGTTEGSLMISYQILMIDRAKLSAAIGGGYAQ